MKMKLAELKAIIKEAVKEIKNEIDPDKSWATPLSADKEGKRGRDSFEERSDPSGYTKSPTGDFSRRLSTLGDGNLYMRQGQANMGPFTAESRVRAMVREFLVKEHRIRIDESGPWSALERYVRSGR
jgi:hypothetical protein